VFASPDSQKASNTFSGSMRLEHDRFNLGQSNFRTGAGGSGEAGLVAAAISGKLFNCTTGQAVAPAERCSLAYLEVTTFKYLLVDGFRTGIHPNNDWLSGIAAGDRCSGDPTTEA